MNILNKNKIELRILGLYMRSSEAGDAASRSSEKLQSRAMPFVFLGHILARRKSAVCFMGGPKRHMQPER
jgi:hypothetical protein